ncbi:hypothetical protein HY251_11940 [bacterium]|nr:hypothetical protein [bacterium]
MRWAVKVLIGGVALVGAAFAARFGYFQLVRRGYVRYNEFDRRERGTLRVGDPAPDLELATYAGEPVRLSSGWKDRPLFVILASCT